MNMNENKWTKEAITSPIVGKISNKYIWIHLTENLNDIYEKNQQNLTKKHEREDLNEWKRHYFPECENQFCKNVTLRLLLVNVFDTNYRKL